MTMRARLLLIDNYDSFTFNLAHLLLQAGDGAVSVDVVRNDEATVDALMAGDPTAIVLSPGPDSPAQTGICSELVRRAAATVPILGVCLGHQVIGEVFGGQTVPAPEVVHGTAHAIEHNGRGLFGGLANPQMAMRYHSLMLDPVSLPAVFEVTAWLRSEAGFPAQKRIPMAMRHRELPLVSVQFHPESIGTPNGEAMARAWLSPLSDARRAPTPAPQTAPARSARPFGPATG